MSECVFCELMQKKANKLFETEKVFVMLSPEPAAAGHMIVLPKTHAPIIEMVPDFVVNEMFTIANKVGVAAFEAMGAHGTNLLVQNGPAAGQKHNHAMIHIIPRAEKDNLQLTWQPKPAEEEALAKAEAKLKEAALSVGTFEREKPKPIEVEAPKEIKTDKDDYRAKQLKRIP